VQRFNKYRYRIKNMDETLPGQFNVRERVVREARAVLNSSLFR